MVQSILSTFFGVCFPHKVVCDEDNDEVFIHLYEASSAVKVVTTIGLLEKCVQDFFPGTETEAFLDRKEPLMMVVNGEMEQQPLGNSFLGTIFEEKFHMKCLSLFILPCVPLIPEHMKRMVHPDISPNQFEEGVKNGYYMVNLSVNQTFGPPEFHASEDRQDDAEIPEDVNMQYNQNFLHSDNDKIVSLSESLHTNNGGNESVEEERRRYDLSSVDNDISENDGEMSEVSQTNDNTSRSPSASSYLHEQSNSSNTNIINNSRRILNPRRIQTTFTPESSQASVISISSSSASIIAAMKKAQLRNSSQYSSSSSEKSKDSSVSKPFRYGSNNTAQQNLDMYISNSRREMSSSSYFNRAGTSAEKSRSNRRVSLSRESTNDYHDDVRSVTPESHKRRFEQFAGPSENANTNGKRTRHISFDGDSESELFTRELSEASVTGVSLNNEVVYGSSQSNKSANESENTTSDSDYSSEMPMTKIRNKGKNKEDSSKPKKKSKGKGKDKTNKGNGTLDQFIHFKP